MRTEERQRGVDTEDKRQRGTGETGSKRERGWRNKEEEEQGRGRGERGGGGGGGGGGEVKTEKEA